jgi:hypothetical protein
MSDNIYTTSRLLKNTHLQRYAHPSSLQRTTKYASFLRISRALHLDVFDQPEKNYFFNNLIVMFMQGIAGKDACQKKAQEAWPIAPGKKLKSPVEGNYYACLLIAIS